MLQLFQTEWCAASRRIRQRLTELGVDYVARQVPADRRKRSALVAATGADSVPTLLLDNGSAVAGEDAIRAYLNEHCLEPASARWHRARAEKARRLYLEEQCKCAQLATREPHEVAVSASSPVPSASLVG